MRQKSMRQGVLGTVVGVVVGVVVGTTLVAPGLPPVAPGADAAVDQDRRPEPLLAAVHPAIDVDPGVTRWRMASAYAESLPLFGELAKRLENRIWRISDGTLEIRFHGPGTLVPEGEVFEAVAAGAIEAAYGSPGDWAGRIPALRLFAAVPFGPSPAAYLAWMEFGGGGEALSGLLGPKGVHGIVCGVTAAAASGWFRDEVRTIDNLRAMTVRMDGLGAKVLERVGVPTSAVAGGDIYLAFEKRSIDGIAFSTPAVDFRLGFQDRAAHYYFPGWQQPAGLLVLLVNGAAWESLSSPNRTRVETACGDTARFGLAKGEAVQFQALRRITETGVGIHRLPTEVLEALRTAWRRGR